MNKDLLKGLTEAQIAKAKACHSTEELMAAVHKEGIELSEEQLAAVSGGACSADAKTCPACGSTDFDPIPGMKHTQLGETYYKCNKCKHRWTEV